MYTFKFCHFILNTVLFPCLIYTGNNANRREEILPDGATLGDFFTNFYKEIVGPPVTPFRAFISLKLQGHAWHQAVSQCYSF